MFAATILEALIQAEQAPVIVLTQPDRPFGRGRRLKPSAVKIVAEREGIEICQPPNLRGVSVADYALDALIVAAYGLLLPPALLAEPRYGAINVHASLLPRWRGAAPVERAMLAGDQTSGVAIMAMDEGLDTGPVYLTRPLPIDPAWTGGDLTQALAQLGAQALLECLQGLADARPTAQDEAGATYAAKLTSADARVDWTCSAEAIARQIRALTPRLPAYAVLTDTRVRLLRAEVAAGNSAADAAPGTIVQADKHGITIATGNGHLLLQRLQLNRGKGQPLAAAAAVNGYPNLLCRGARFDADPG
jgi:methionyl-tRNA formyltransferase